MNTANTRIFNFGLNGARVKLRRRRQRSLRMRDASSTTVLLAPSERAVLDVLFETPGDVRLEHRTPDHVYDLGTVLRRSGARRRGRRVVRHPAHRSRAAPPSISRSTTTSSVRRTRCSPSGPRCRSSTATTTRPANRLPRLPDAPRGHRVVRRHLPEVRDEAGAGAVRTPDADAVHLPDARRDRRRWAATCPLCGMTLLRSDARRRQRRARPRRAAQPRTRRQHRVGRRHGRRSTAQTNTSNMIWQLIDRRDRREERGHLLEVHGG